MADIEVVIKIDEDIYNRFTHNEVRPRFEITEEERFQMDADAVRLTRAFCNGTPLPKGHGRLIDADAFCERYDSNINGNIDENYIFAPTIIEADVPKRRKGTPLEENDSGYNFENWIP